MKSTYQLQSADATYSQTRAYLDRLYGKINAGNINENWDNLQCSKDLLVNSKGIKNQNIELQNIQSWLGQEKQLCLKKLQQWRLDYVLFAHWLAIPQRNMLLTFRHQQCVAVEDNLDLSWIKCESAITD